MSKKISLGVAATIAIIAMAVTFSLTMVVSMKMFNTTVSSVKNKERQYNKLSEIDRFVRSEEFFTIDEDTLNDRLAAGYMNGINDKYAVYYTAKEYSEKQAVEKGTLTGIGVAVVNDASSGYARIIRLYDNSPAAEAGMQVGGFITAINDESTRNITSSARLRRRSGSRPRWPAAAVVCCARSWLPGNARCAAPPVTPGSSTDRCLIRRLLCLRPACAACWSATRTLLPSPWWMTVACHCRRG